MGGLIIQQGLSHFAFVMLFLLFLATALEPAVTNECHRAFSGA